MSLSSGSCGNCYYLERTDADGQRHAILIDAGVSLRRLKQVLMSNGLDYNSFSAVLVTHDHMDHIRSLASYNIAIRRGLSRRAFRYTIKKK